jgi:hypothetical protein
MSNIVKYIQIIISYLGISEYKFVQGQISFSEFQGQVNGTVPLKREERN